MDYLLMMSPVFHASPRRLTTPFAKLHGCTAAGAHHNTVSRSWLVDPTSIAAINNTSPVKGILSSLACDELALTDRAIWLAVSVFIEQVVKRGCVNTCANSRGASSPNPDYAASLWA